MSLPHVAWRSGQSAQPLRRQLAWSVTFLLLEVGLNLELQVVIGTPHNPFLAAPQDWKGEERGCSMLSLHTYGAGESGAGYVPSQQHWASTRAGGCAGSPPGTPLFLAGSHTSTHCWLQYVTAQRGRENCVVEWHEGGGDGCWEGLSAVPPPACWHRDLSGGPCTPMGSGEEVGEDGETLALLLQLSVCRTLQILCQ